MAHMARFIISESSTEYVNEMTEYNIIEGRDGYDAISLKQNSLPVYRFVISYQFLSGNFAFNPSDESANVGAKVSYLQNDIIVTGFFWGNDYGRIEQTIRQFLGGTPLSISPVSGLYTGTLGDIEVDKPDIGKLE